MSKLVEWAIRVWAGWLVLCAVLWVLVRGMRRGWEVLNLLPLAVTDAGPLSGLRTGLTFGAFFRDGGVSGRMYDLSAGLTDLDAYNRAVAAGEASGRQLTLADVNVGWSIQVTSPLWPQELVLIALNVVTLLVTAWLWWWLARAVRQSRTGAVFTPDNARRLMVAGAVVLAGAPLSALAHWGLHRWALSTTQLADQLLLPAFGPLHVPWAAVALGAVLIVLGSVWQRAVVLEREVAGLV